MKLRKNVCVCICVKKVMLFFIILFFFLHYTMFSFSIYLFVCLLALEQFESGSIKCKNRKFFFLIVGLNLLLSGLRLCKETNV